MAEKSLILSSSGMRNIIFTSTQENNNTDEFRFIFGKEEIKMRYLFAEFLSPRVSRMHQTDPTINSLDLSPYYQQPNNSKELINRLILDKINELSRGFPITITEDICDDLRYLSIILGNEELLTKLDDIYPEQNESKRTDRTLQYLRILGNDNILFNFEIKENQSNMIDEISSQFYLIDKEKLKKLPKSILYLIITNEHIKLNSEDSLLDFINELFENVSSDEEKLKTEFYEAIEYTSLSEEKMNEFIDNLNPNEISMQIWSKLKTCFYSNSEIVIKLKPLKERIIQYQNRYINCEKEENKQNFKTIEFDKNFPFKGILTDLGNGNPLNAYNEIIMGASSSSIHSGCIANVFNFQDDNNYFISMDSQNSWFCYDFKQRKVKISHYSLKSHGLSPKRNHRLISWCIEGSNDQNNWNQIDSRQNEESVADVSASNTFKINEDESKNDFYRFVRIRQTGANNSNNNHLVFAAIEFFGSIIEP